MHELCMKPCYRWSNDAGVWVLQGLHRLAPVEIFPSNLRPLPPLPVIDDYHIEWVKPRDMRYA